MKLSRSGYVTRRNGKSSLINGALTTFVIFGYFFYSVTSVSPRSMGKKFLSVVRNVFEDNTCKDMCLSRECINTASTILKNMDENINPCDDFYKFSCGGYINFTILPDDKKWWDAISPIKQKIQNQLRIAFEANSEPDEPKPFRQIKDFYKSCMNMTPNKEQVSKPLHDILSKLGGWPVIEGDTWDDRRFDWMTTIYKVGSNEGLQHSDLLDIFVGLDTKDSSKRIIYIDKGVMLKSHRNLLLKGFENERNQINYNYTVHIATYLGASKDRAVAEMKEAFLFAIQLANISLSVEEQRGELPYRISLAQLTDIYPRIRWTEILTELMRPYESPKSYETVIVLSKRYIDEFEKLMAHTPKRVQANYIMWKMLEPTIENLLPNDEKKCIDETLRNLYLSSKALYVRKYFDNNAKHNVTNMIADLTHQFDKILQQVEWMDDKTKEKARKKVSAMRTTFGYPDELMNDNELDNFYKNLELSDDYFQNILNLNLFKNKQSFKSLREPVIPDDWTIEYEDEITYDPQYNNLVLQLGLLQDFFFSSDRPIYMNYGAIGTMIGHEITHALDNTGRQYDEYGNWFDWWERSTKELYLDRVKCIINWYSNYTVDQVALNINGARTLDENIADIGGTKVAYLAYTDWTTSNPSEQKLPGLSYTPRQMFWISMANGHCAKYRPGVLRSIITNNDHSPSEVRVNGIVSNIPEFSKDFNCSIGSKMNPERRCPLW